MISFDAHAHLYVFFDHKTIQQYIHTIAHIRKSIQYDGLLVVSCTLNTFFWYRHHRDCAFYFFSLSLLLQHIAKMKHMVNGKVYVHIDKRKFITSV